MIKRRTTLKLGLSGAIASNFPLQALADRKPSTGMAELPEFRILYNSNYQESRNLATSLDQHEIQLEDLSQGLATLWYRKLKPELAHRPAVLFGMSDRIDHFCLEELARDFGMKTVFRVEHVIAADGRVTHVAAGNQNLQDIDSLLTAGTGFGFRVRELASLALQNQAQDSATHKSSGPFSIQGKTTLVSWMIS